MADVSRDLGQRALPKRRRKLIAASGKTDGTDTAGDRFADQHRLETAAGAPRIDPDDAAPAGDIAGGETVASRRRRGVAAAPAAQRPDEMARSSNGWIVTIFFVTMIVPFVFSFGALQLTPYRIFLLLMVPILLVMWLMGRAGPVRAADWAVAALCAWSALTLVIIHGPITGIESGGILFAETMGPYLLARITIRTAGDFRHLALTMFRIVLVLAPFAIIEALTTNNLILTYANEIGQSHDVVPKNPRWGLDRAQGPFGHPILFGVFCGAMLTVIYFALGYGHSWFRRVSQAGIVGFVGALSLSSGPMAAMLAQALLLAWDSVMRFLRERWILLLGGVAALVIAIEIAANRNSLEIFIEQFAFSKATAWNRLRIWTYGSASVVNNPLFGIGFNEWERPSFMPLSIDMFWLVPGVRHGLLGALLMQIIVFTVFLQAAFAKVTSPRVAAYRKGFVLCIVGYYLAGWTVHYWNAVYVQFFFVLGSGAWILDHVAREKAWSAQNEGPAEPHSDDTDAVTAENRPARRSGRRAKRRAANAPARGPAAAAPRGDRAGEAIR